MTVIADKDASTIRFIDAGSKPRGLAILVAESVYSVRQGDAGGDVVPRETIAQHSGLISDVIQKYQGQIVRAMGASVMAEFVDVEAAVQAAVTMQRLQAESNHSLANESSNTHSTINSNGHSNGHRPDLRIGIHGMLGQPIGMDFFGEAACATTKIVKRAAPGQILVSQSVCEALGKEGELHLQWSQKIEDEDVFEVRSVALVVGIPSRYEALFQVGAGGMGILYKARDRETGDIIALKVLRSEIAADPEMQENLRREVRLARKVTHKNVCRIHEFNRADGMACISMEFVEGTSLQAMLQRSGPLPWSQALKIALQICSGLGEAHAQGIVHRDLKPANVMIDRDGVVKIMDFGIARPFNGTAQLTGTLIGTPAYMAPEQVELKGADARTDVYALGLLLYEIVTGLQAFGGDTPIAVAVKQLQESAKRPREIVFELPAQAENVILTCLEKDPSKRYQSMDELAMALRRHTQTKPAPALWGPFVADMRSYGRDFQTYVQPRMQELKRYVRQQDWKFFQNTRRRRTFVVGLGAACLLAALVAVGVRGTRSRRAAIAASAEVPIAAGSSLVSAAPASAQLFAAQSIGAGDLPAPTAQMAARSAGGDTSTWPHEVDLTAGNNAAPQARSSSTDASTGTLVGAPLNGQGAKADPSKKTPRTIRGPASASTLAKTRASQPTVSALPAANSAAPVSNIAVQSELSNETEASQSAASHLTAAVPTPPAAVASIETRADSGAISGAHYFDVGSFKESAWADSAVEKLTQLGFHAVSVRKNVLWVQSYQVRVGPYADPQDVENARQALIAQGFKPRATKLSEKDK